MKDKTNVYQITPDRQSKFRISILMAGEEKKNSQGNKESKKRKGVGAEYIFSSQDGIGYCHWKLW